VTWTIGNIIVVFHGIHIEIILKELPLVIVSQALEIMLSLGARV
jgi:hypothetical protein